MQLYVGSTREFVDDAMQHRLAEKIGDAFYDYYGYRNLSELQSWQNSLTSMAMQLMHGRLLDNGIAVEMELPLSSSRLDCMIFGLDADSRPAAALVELKQWSQARASEVDGCVTTYVGKAERTMLHPSLQAITYAQYLADSHEGYDETDGV